ncbi:BRICHOS domain-containing protein 5 [Paroedura picta]|uniref:BRICHOS domain-containing protein 5 n=1 Tax=Paroedura picta TaxID=143630 RepID=UPI0040576480
MEDQAAAHPTPASEKRAPPEARSLPRFFWVVLSVILTGALVCMAVVGALSFSQRSPKPLPQVVRLNFQNRPGSPMNQSAFVDKSSSTVSYYVTSSSSNRTTAVLFDGKNGYVCYKPGEQNTCYLRTMDGQDRETLQVFFDLSQHRVDQLPLPNDRTRYYREFLGIVPGRPLRPEEAGEAVHSLCEETPIYWVKKKDGPAKQRLIYLCIDICFPSNICVSICFYYLPE